MNDKIRRTIVHNIRLIHYYPFVQLDGAILGAVERAINDSNLTKRSRNQVFIVLKLFECFLQVTGKHLSLLDLSSKKLSKTIKIFIGALWSNFFITATIPRRHQLTYAFKNLLVALQTIIPVLLIPEIIIRSNCANAERQVFTKRFESLPLIDDQVYYWNGWLTYNKHNKLWFVPLNGIYECYGYAFTVKMFNQIDMMYSNSRASERTTVGQFCRWLPTSGYTVIQFDNAANVYNLFQEFLSHFMIAGYKNGESRPIKNLLLQWQRFISIVEKYFLGSIFAEPYGQLVSPEPILIKGNERRISITEDGIEVKEKLLTDIPLHITDDQAIELLFKQIQTDFDHIVMVAEHQANDLWRRFLRRKELAKKGVARELIETTCSRYLVKKGNSTWLSNACATFEKHGFFSKNLLIFVGSHPFRETVFELGLPSAYTLIPHMVLLVAEHPNIVSSFLNQFELYNKQGKLTGFVQLDGGWVLDGRKPRRGPGNAQQLILLTEKSKVIVEQIIAITTCVRQYLKEKEDDSWRYLLLASHNGFSPKRMIATYAQAKKSKKTFYQALVSPTQDITLENAEKLSKRFTFGALRASKGVLVYLETKNVTAMAVALGHKEHSASLLSHYLPEIILDFFQSRWIRTFQQSIIVEAMKESHLLLEATEFNNMNEFHDFMQHHALKTIPMHLEDPDGETEQPKLQFSDEIIFSINTQMLTMLLSLQQAVVHAHKRVCGKAAYWSELTKHLVIHIENSSHHVSGEYFKLCLAEARKQVNPSKMEIIIYG